MGLRADCVVVASAVALAASAGAYTRILDLRVAYWEGRARAAESRVGSTCSPVYALLWPEFACSARLSWPPVACSPRVVVYRHSDLERVRARATEAGPRAGLLLLEERGLRERDMSLTFRAEVR